MANKVKFLRKSALPFGMTAIAATLTLQVNSLKERAKSLEDKLQASTIEFSDPNVRMVEYYSDGDDSDWSYEVNQFINDGGGPNPKPTTLVFSSRTYNFKEEIKVCVPGLKFKGQGIFRTIFTASITRNLFTFPGDDECGNIGAGRDFILHGFTILNNNSPPDVTFANAIEMRRNGIIEYVRIQGGWASGIRIEANHNLGENANGWTLVKTIISSTRYAGIVVQGPDSNVGLGEQVSVSSTCQRYEDYPEGPDYPPCAGIIERSFLGSTLIAAHSSNSGPLGNRVNAYAMDGSSQRSVCLGCYREGSNDPNSPVNFGRLGQNSIAIGGLSGWSGGGMGLNAGRITNSTIYSPIIRRAGANNIFIRLIDDDGRDFRIETNGSNSLRGSTGSTGSTTGFYWGTSKFTPADQGIGCSCE